MSSKDLIIADIIEVITQQKKDKRERSIHFCSYYFKYVKSLLGINCIITLEISFGLANDNDPNKFRGLIKIIHPQMNDEQEEGVDHLYSKILGQYPKFNEENLSLLLDTLLKLLPRLKFNIFNGQFCEKESISSALFDLFKDIEGLKFRGEECPVCKDHIVNTKTKCGHYLCVPCFQELKFIKINEDGDEDANGEEEVEFKKCPMCREHIRYTTC